MHRLRPRSALIPLALLLAAPGAAAQTLFAGGDFPIHAEPDCVASAPQVAGLPGGGFVAVWTDFEEDTNDLDVAARLFDATGRPLGPVFVANLPTEGSQLPMALASDLQGRFAVLWRDTRDLLLARVFDATGQPLGGEMELFQIPPDLAIHPVLAAGPDGHFVAAWESSPLDLTVVRFDPAGDPPAGFTVPGDFAASNGRPAVAVDEQGRILLAWLQLEAAFPFPRSAIVARPFDAGGAPLGEPVRATEGGAEGSPAIAVAPGGDFAVAWRDAATQAIVARRFTGDGAALGGAVRLSSEDQSAASPELAPLPDARFAAVWEGFGRTHPTVGMGQVYGRILGLGGLPDGPQIRINESSIQNQRDPDVAPLADGRIVAVWQALQTPPPVDPFPPCFPGNGVLGRILAVSCPPQALCLAAGRFRVQVAWEDPFNGGTGVGHPVPLTGDTGAFWFFDQANLELMTKLIDGRSVNGNFWFFYGALSNVGYEITVTDQVTAEVQTYVNPPFFFGSRGDTLAFPAP